MFKDALSVLVINVILRAHSTIGVDNEEDPFIRYPEYDIGIAEPIDREIRRSFGCRHRIVCL